MKHVIEVLIPDLAGGSIIEDVIRQITDVVAGHGCTPVVSAFTPAQASLDALETLTVPTFPTRAGTQTRPVAAVRTYAE